MHTRLLFATLAGFAGSVFAAEVSGTWKAEFDTQIGVQKYTYTLNRNDREHRAIQMGDQLQIEHVVGVFGRYVQRQRNVTELVVEGPAVSPAGRSSGGLFHGAQSSRPASRPSTTTAATAITGTAHFRRLRGAGAAAGSPAAGGVSSGCSDVSGGRAPG